MHPLHKNLLALAALLLAGALAWWLFAMDSVAAPAPSGSDPKAAAEAVVAANDSTPRQTVEVPVSADVLRIRGRVVDAFGEPVGSALVGDAAAAAPVHTAADGTFEVLVDAAPALTLLVLAAGHAPLFAPLEPGGVAGVHDAGDLALRQEGHIRGTVVSSDAALPGAAITLRFTSGGVPAGLEVARLLPQAVTDSAGTYTLPALMPGNYRVTAEAPGMQRGQSGSVTVREGQATVVDPIALAPGFTLEGVVLGPGDRAVEGAEVRIRGGPNQGRQLATVTTAADGSFRAAALPPGPLRVAAKKQGFQPGAAEGDATRQERLVVRLPAGLQLRGVAVDAISGRPVERFALAVRRLGDVDPATNGTMQQQLQRRAAALRTEAAAASDADDARRRLAIAEQFEARLQALAQGEALPAAVPADLGAEQQHSAGQFVCDGLEAGLYVVGVASPEHQYTESAIVPLTADAPAGELRLLLPAGRRLTGVVVRARDGVAVAGARVELVRIATSSDAAAGRSLYPWAFAKGKAGITLMATTTGSDGRFQFRPAAADDCLLTVRHDDIADHDTEPFYLQGIDHRRIAVGERATLGGRVRGPARAGGVTVLVLGGHGTLRTTKAQPDGSYHFAGLQPGSYLVRAFPSDQTQYQSRLLGSIFPLHAGAVDVDAIPSCDVTLEAGERRAFDVDLDLPATGSVQGGFTINGQPGRGGRAVLEPVAGEAKGSGGLSLRGVCDETGRFAIADVPAGNYTLRLHGSTRQELHQQAITVTAGAVASAQVDAHAGGLRGRILVTDAAAADLRGYVWVLPGAEAAPDDLYDYRRSHRSHRISVQGGVFEDLCLSPGAAVVVAELRGRARAVVKVVVPDGGVGAVDLTVGTR